MNLEKWAEYGWLKAEPTSRDEITSLLTIVDRDLKENPLSLEGLIPLLNSSKVDLRDAP
jgi:hypothetical protein